MLSKECYVKGLKEVKELSSILKRFGGKSIDNLLLILEADGVIEDTNKAEVFKDDIFTVSANYKSVGVTLFIDEDSCRVGGIIEIFDESGTTSDDRFDIQTLEYYVSKLNAA